MSIGFAPYAFELILKSQPTPAGDPIEVGALGQALGGGGSRKQGTAAGRPLAALSNKACYGHTEGTAGITGLILALQARSLKQGLKTNMYQNSCVLRS